MMDDSKEIWLQPWCEKCASDPYGAGRQWCQDNVWRECEECGARAVKYVLEPAMADRNDPDEAAKLLSQWIGYDWDGLREGRLGAQYPQWVDGRFQGGKMDLHDIAQQIVAIGSLPIGGE